MVLQDLSSAFDTVDHNIMLQRLSAIGITGTAHNWFRSYLTERSYQILIDNTISKPRQIDHGVPQGSVLAPLLFNNDLLPLFQLLHKYSDIKYHTYADDIQIYQNIIDFISPLTITSPLFLNRSTIIFTLHVLLDPASKST